MPFGKKKSYLDPTHPEVLETIDFDPVWEKILAPGIPSEFAAVRADETQVSGIIDKVYIEHLLNADVVLDQVKEMTQRAGPESQGFVP